MLCSQPLWHTPCYLLTLSRALCTAESPEFSILCSQEQNVPVFQEGFQTSKQERGAGSSASDKDSKFAHGHSWERLSLVTDPKAKASGLESSAQTPRVPGLGLHREGTWCSCSCSPLSAPVASIQGNQLQQGAWRSRAPGSNVIAVMLPFCLQAKRKAKAVGYPRRFYCHRWEYS